MILPLALLISAANCELLNQLLADNIGNMNSMPPTHGFVGEALLEKPHDDELDQTWSDWALLTEDLIGKTKQPNAVI